jgi:hypothetical protein
MVNVMLLEMMLSVSSVIIIYTGYKGRLQKRSSPSGGLNFSHLRLAKTLIAARQPASFASQI